MCRTLSPKLCRILLATLIVATFGAVYVLTPLIYNNLNFVWTGESGYNATLITLIDSSPAITLNTKIYMKPVSHDEDSVTAHLVFSDMMMNTAGMQSPIFDEGYIEKLVVPVIFGHNGSIFSVSLPEFLEPEIKRMLETVIYIPETIIDRAEYTSKYDDSRYKFTEKKDGIVEKTILSSKGKHIAKSTYTAELSDTFWLKRYEGGENGVSSGFAYTSSVLHVPIAFDEKVFSLSGETPEAQIQNSAKVYDEWQNQEAYISHLRGSVLSGQTAMHSPQLWHSLS